MSQGLVRDFKGRPLLSIPLSPEAPGNPEHAGAILALMFVDEHGNAITDFGGIGGATPDAWQVPYTTASDPSIQSVGDALDQLLFVPMALSMAGGGSYEHGASLPFVNLSWSISKAISSQLLSGPGAVQPALDARTSVAVGPFTSNTTWTLLVTAADGVEQKSASTSIAFYNRRYWGVSASQDLSDAEVLALSSELAGARAQTRTFNGQGQYLWFAWPESMGAPVFTVNGLRNTAWVETIRSFTNALGYTTNYRLYRSQFVQNGTGIQVGVS